MSVYNEIEKALQEFIAPDIQGIRGELKAVNIRLESIDRRFDDLIERLELDRRIERLERKAEEKRPS